MDSTLIFFGFFAVSFCLVVPLLVLLHELGHAVPALLFTRSRVTMYLGSHGDATNTWRVQVGLLEIYVKRYPLWTKGMCVHATDKLSKIQRLIIIVGGVLISIVVTALGFYASLAFDLHGSLKLLLFLLLIYSLVINTANLVPSQRGGIATDGMLLKLLLTNKNPATQFSTELQELIARSREVAIDLGYDYISILHLFLADCAMPYSYSLAGLFFPERAEYTAFYESCRIGPANTAAGSLPITTEFEGALKQSGLTRRNGFKQQVYPYHLFIAACEMTAADWVNALPPMPGLPQRIQAYYRGFVGPPPGPT